MNILKGLEMDAQEKLVELNVCGGMTGTTLGYTEHLIYQIFHIVKHFVLQGVGMQCMCGRDTLQEKVLEELSLLEKKGDRDKRR